MSDDPKDIVRRDHNRLKGMRMRDEFMCPITYSLMREPTVASDGHTYERQALEDLMRRNMISPMTRQALNPQVIFPNRPLKELIIIWREEHRHVDYDE